QTKPLFSTLITWSHGAGVGIFNPQTGGLEIETNPYNLIRNYTALHKFFDKDRFNCTTLQIHDTIIINNPINNDVNCPGFARLFIDGYIRLNPTRQQDAAIVYNDLTAILQLKPLLNNICNFFERNFALDCSVIENVLADRVAFSEKDFLDLVLFFDRIQAGL